MQELTQFVASHMALFCAFTFVLVLLTIVEFLRAKRNNFSINVPQAVRLINHENAVVIDTRGNDNYKRGHIIDAVSLPPSELVSNNKKIEKYRTKPLIIVCNSGLESQKIASTLIKQGYNTYSLSGGIRAWLDAQMPLIKE